VVRDKPLSERAAVRVLPAWLLSFACVLLLGADDGGYWPTAWDWTALVLLTVASAALVAKPEVRIGKLQAALPAGLLALTLWEVVSVSWAGSATPPLLYSQRTLSYAAATFAALLVVRRRAYRALLAGVWSGVTVVCAYSLLTRLFPERLGVDDSLAGYRLEAPLGYWNALAILAALGAILAAGFVARGRTPVVRALAAASTVVLAPALYFTFSRGGWLALGAGFAVMVAADRRRLQLVTALAVAAPWPALVIWRASLSAPLTHVGGSAGAAEHAGRHYLFVLAALAAAAAGTTALYALVEPRVHVARAARIAYAALLGLLLAGVVAASTVHYGSPQAIARKAYRSLVGQSRPVQNHDLNTRLFSLGLGQRIPQFRVAWREFEAHPLLGSGEGTYERYWNRYRPVPAKVRNAHNLYLETLAELGPVGLALLLVALGAPLVAFPRARSRSLSAAALGAYVAFLAHVSVDWDWQMPAVTLAALFSGAAILVAPRRAPRPLPAVVCTGAAVAAAALAAFVFVSLKSNAALAASRADTARGDFPAAATQAVAARRWAPWSGTPWQLLGEAQAARGESRPALASFRKAVARDPGDWTIWLDLAVAARGAERRDAFARASRLNPLSPEIASWGTTLAQDSRR
jgi:Flp pilus assembly protein TadD